MLDQVVHPFLQSHPEVAEFQHDNATHTHTPHKVRIYQQYVQQHNINTMEWPRKSLDFSLIDNFGDYLNKHGRGRLNPPRILAQLRDTLSHTWRPIPQPYIRSIFNSMPCLWAWIRLGHTGYWTVQHWISLWCNVDIMTVFHIFCTSVINDTVVVL